MSDIYPLLTTVNEAPNAPQGVRQQGVKGKCMLRGSARIGALALATVLMLSAPALAQGPGPGTPPASYQVTSAGPDGLEIRFRGMPLRTVRADDSQNALSLDFHTPVDGAVFERLPAEMPQWISMAYATFDNGVIRSPRPGHFPHPHRRRRLFAAHRGAQSQSRPAAGGAKLSPAAPDARR
jgi:hypothetical protein